MGGTHRKNKARNQLRYSKQLERNVNAKWFAKQIKRRRVREKMAKLSRRRNRK